MPKHLFLEPRRLIGKLIGANMNSTADQAITIVDIADYPSSKYIITSTDIYVTNASISLTTAAGGIYTAASKSGAIVSAAQTYSALTTSNKYIRANITGDATTDLLAFSTLYLSLTTPQGAAATADIYIFGQLLQ